MKFLKTLFARSEFVVFLGLLAVGAFFSTQSPVFLSSFNLQNIILQSSIQGVIAIGMTFVILTAGIDLSVGSVVALSGILMATMLHSDMPVVVVILVNLMFGVAVGMFNGFSITKMRMAPFIVTLAVMAMARGLTMVVSDGKTLFAFPESFNYFGSGKIGPVSVTIVIFLFYAIAAEILLQKTVLGRNIYATGSNIKAAASIGHQNRQDSDLCVCGFRGVLCHSRHHSIWPAGCRNAYSGNRCRTGRDSGGYYWWCIVVRWQRHHCGYRHWRAAYRCNQQRHEPDERSAVLAELYQRCGYLPGCVDRQLEEQPGEGCCVASELTNMSR